MIEVPLIVILTQLSEAFTKSTLNFKANPLF